MSEWAAKRFWKETTVTERPEGFGVALDGRAVKTPAKAALTVPTRAYAEAIAAEWDAQDGAIQPHKMPVTRSANAAIDKVARQHPEVVAHVCEFGGTDLLCYRAEAPAELVDLQAEKWDPLLEWAAQTYGAALKVTTGILPVDQPADHLARLEAEVAALDPFALAALHDLVGITGSLVLGLAVARGRLSAEEAWALSRLDEDWQIAQWGEDEEAAEIAAHKREALCDAARIWSLAER
ncbi:ATPase [Thioclava sp. F1Mire-8]|uniref:ATP12 family chaperone protein n=1 Tax=Thioclava sp. F1Mire-8 TaxID=1973006 RepID=UPI000B538D2C|nr:ATP12 family protein [Thioclava sp. F1Mire-8]OWY01102.1 ATPase [Thioclava sp. F1Mire-8]